MKRILLITLSLFSLQIFASDLELNFASKNEVEKIGNEFAVNFQHNSVAAPETEGLWGVEIGLIAAGTKSPKLSDVVDETGNDGSKFKTIYSGGVMARAHGPFDLFLETTYLPQRTFSDVKVKNKTLGLGWNLGSFFNLPLDVAVGLNFSQGEGSFKQVINNSSTSNTDVNADIGLRAKTRVIYAAVSKKVLFFTPYFKIGAAKSTTNIETSTAGLNGTIFAYTNAQNQSVTTSGAYTALGLNFQIFFTKLGLEVSRTIGVGQVAGKFSFDF